jgi:hypothetical protein
MTTRTIEWSLDALVLNNQWTCGSDSFTQCNAIKTRTTTKETKSLERLWLCRAAFRTDLHFVTILEIVGVKLYRHFKDTTRQPNHYPINLKLYFVVLQLKRDSLRLKLNERFSLPKLEATMVRLSVSCILEAQGKAQCARKMKDLIPESLAKYRTRVQAKITITIVD